LNQAHVSLCLIVVPWKGKMMRPQTFQETQKWVPEWNDGRRRGWSTLPNSQHFRARRACLSSGMGLGRTHKREFRMKSTCITKKRGRYCKLNGNGVTNLIRTTSSTSFTQLATFGRRHHSLPYNIFCAFPWGLHPNVTFPRGSQVRVPKLKLLLSQNFGRSYLSQIKSILKVQG